MIKLFGFSKKDRIKTKKMKKSLKDKLKDVILLYDDLYFCKDIKNSTILGRRIDAESLKLGIDFLGSYDGDNVSFYYLIEKMPRELFVNFKERLRRECKRGVRVTFLNNLRKHKIEWESAQMRSRLRVLREVGSENRQQDVDAYNLHENINTLGRQAWIEESLVYLADADKKRGRALLKSTLLVIISGKRGIDFDDSIKLIEDHARHIGISMERILYEIPDIIRYYSPFSHSYLKNIEEISSTQVLTDETVARYSTYTQGTLGVKGTYFGTDIYSRFPVLKVVKVTEDAPENWLITAETGGGKSFLVKMLILELLSLGYNGTIMDIEGFEYIPLANFLSHKSKVEIINMGEGSGKYFDPVEIAEEIGIEDIDKDAKNMSINFTIAIFKVLLGKAYTQDVWLDTVINDAVAETYKEAGVTEDRETWVNAKGLALIDVYKKLVTLRTYREDQGYISAVEQAMAITSRYFETDGTRAGIFKTRVNVIDIVDADLVVCSFGMAGKSPQSVDEIQLALMQLGAAQLSHQRSIFSKSRGKFNFKLWEEFQRWGKFPDSDKTLGVAITGGRKLGDVNMIITNVVKELLDDDRFGILSNITSFLVGAIGDDEVRENLCKRMSIPLMKPELDLIAAAKRVSDEVKGAIENEDPYRFAFLCGLDRSKYGVVKVILPSELKDSALFRTGVDITKKGGD